MAGMKFRLWSYVFSTLILLLLVWSSKSFILTHYANFFFIDNASKEADAIIILSGGKVTRTPKGIELWEKKFAPLIFLTDEKQRISGYQHLEVSNLEFARRVARYSNIDNIPWAIIPSISGGATSTFDEAEDSLIFARKQEWNHIIIVTDHFHSRRALHAFKKVFRKSGIKVEVGAANNDIFDATNWWTSDRGISSIILETIKYPIYVFWKTEPKIIRND